MDKEVRKLVSALERIDGVEVNTGGSGHLLVTKDGGFVVSLSSTPSDPRWKANALSILRKAGITPASRPEKLARPAKVLQSVDVVQRLKPIREARRTAEFARFTQQLGEVRGMRVFKTVDSAATTIANVANGKSASDWAMVLISAGLLEWQRWAKQPEPEQAVEVASPVVTWEQPVSGPKLVVDLGRLVDKLAEFGITLEVQ